MRRAPGGWSREDGAHDPLLHCGITDGAQQRVPLLAQSVTPEGAAGGLLDGGAASPLAAAPLHLHDLGVVGHAFFPLSMSIGLCSEF